MYSTTKLPVTIPAQTLRAKRCCAACGRFPCGLSKAHMLRCTYWTPLDVKNVASSLNVTEQKNYGSTELWRRNHCANATRRGWSSRCSNWTVWRWKECKSFPYRMRWTVDWNIPMAAVSCSILIPEFWTAECNRSSSNVGLRGQPVYCIVAVKVSHSPRFWCTRVTFNDMVCASLMSSTSPPSSGTPCIHF